MYFFYPAFIFGALPIFLIIFYAVPFKVRPAVLALINLAFYILFAKEYAVILIASVLINHALSGRVSKKDKAAYGLSLFINAGSLIAFKIIAPFALSLDLPWRNGFSVILPLGMSFYVFKLISYQTDLYRGDAKRASLTDLAVYVGLFSQIISGPISRIDHINTNRFLTVQSTASVRLRIRRVLENIEDGLKYFIIGMFFKTIIADHLAILWNEIGTIGYESISTPLAWAGAFIYSLNIYFDFWGYSLMAAGLGVMMGFVFIRNFHNPYSASGVTDFYRRWHITLGAWFKDYIYIPLGGNRKKPGRVALNLTIVWLLTGLWHGVTLNYLLWAAMILLLILCEKFILSKNETVRDIIGRINVLILIPVSWVLFAIPDPGSLLQYMMRLIGIASDSVNTQDLSRIWSEGWAYIIGALLLLAPGLTRLYKKHKNDWYMLIILFVMFWASVYSISATASNPFMYMSF